MKRSEQIIVRLETLGLHVETDMPGEGFNYRRSEPLHEEEDWLTQEHYDDLGPEAARLLRELEEITTGDYADYEVNQPDPFEPRDYNDLPDCQTMADFQ